jgi:glycosyltransferase involved in cell wall biosynthesis
MDTISLEQNPLLSDVVLARPEDLTSTRCPTVALHLLVKNGESCVGRLIDNVGPYIHEVVAVVNDTTDKTISVLQAKCDQYDLELHVITVTVESHPEFYINDVAETYQEGKPLAGECYEGPFTGKPLLANWAAVRNLGWVLGRSEWKLFLDADDTVEDPESIPGLCLALEERGVDLATSRYQYRTTADGRSQSDAFRERLAANVPAIEWHGHVHEVLKGQSVTAHIEGNLRVIDMRDSTGLGLRPPGRCFKILYHEARSKGWEVSPRTLIYLAMEAKRTMPRLAEAVLNRYLERATWREERSWALVMRGEIREAEENFEAASTWYRLALLEHPGVKSAFRLCHTTFQEGKWQESVDAYHLGLANKSILQVVDSGAAIEDSSKILMAAALRKLGRVAEAMKFCEDALLEFPANSALQELHDGLARDLSRGVEG